MSTWLSGPSHQDRSGRATCQSQSQIDTSEEYWPSTLAPSWLLSSAPLNLKIHVNIEGLSLLGQTSGPFWYVLQPLTLLARVRRGARHCPNSVNIPWFGVIWCEMGRYVMVPRNAENCQRQSRSKHSGPWMYSREILMVTDRVSVWVVLRSSNPLIMVKKFNVQNWAPSHFGPIKGDGHLLLSNSLFLLK